MGDDDTDFIFAAHPGESIDAAYVIGRAIQLVRERPREVIGVAAASVLLSWALLFGMMSLGILHNSLWAAAGVGEVMHPVGVIVLLVIGWAAALLLQAPLVGSAIEVHLDERRGLFASLLSRGMSQLPQLMGASALVMLAVVVVVSAAMGIVAGVVALAAEIPWGVAQVLVSVVGSIVVLVYAMRAIAGVSLLVPVMLVEGLGIGDAIGRAWEMGWRHGFAILSALILPTVLVEGILFPTQFMPPWVGLSVGITLGVALVLYQTAVAPVTYVAIREYVEGLHPGRVMESLRPTRARDTRASRAAPAPRPRTKTSRAKTPAARSPRGASSKPERRRR